MISVWIVIVYSSEWFTFSNVSHVIENGSWYHVHNMFPHLTHCFHDFDHIYSVCKHRVPIPENVNYETLAKYSMMSIPFLKWRDIVYSCFTYRRHLVMLKWSLLYSVIGVWNISSLEIFHFISWFIQFLKSMLVSNFGRNLELNISRNNLTQ